MKPIFLVTEDDFALSNRMIRKLLSTPLDGGITFAGIKIRPACNLQPRPVFELSIGCDTNRDPSGIALFAKYLLKEDVDVDTQLIIDVFRGYTRQSFA